jgi:hypothetical protein
VRSSLTLGLGAASAFGWLRCHRSGRKPTHPSPSLTPGASVHAAAVPTGPVAMLATGSPHLDIGDPTVAFGL